MNLIRFIGVDYAGGKEGIILNLDCYRAILSVGEGEIFVTNLQGDDFPIFAEYKTAKKLVSGFSSWVELPMINPELPAQLALINLKGFRSFVSKEDYIELTFSDRKNKGVRVNKTVDELVGILRERGLM